MRQCWRLVASSAWDFSAPSRPAKTILYCALPVRYGIFHLDPHAS
jgi:hypothetical protein